MNKTVSLDAEAFERLQSVRLPSESYSQTIKRVVRRPVDAGRVIADVRALDDEHLKAVETQVARHRGNVDLGSFR